MRSNTLPLGLKCQVRREDLWKLSCQDSWPIHGVWDLSPCPACPVLPSFPVPVKAGALGRALLGAGELASMAGNELLLSHISAHPGLDTGMARLEYPWGQVWLTAPAPLCRGGLWGEEFSWDLSGVNIPDGCALTRDPAGVGMREALQLLSPPL